MPDLSYRSTEEELLDQAELDKQELFRNLFELDRINSLLGGHSATLRGLKKLLTDKSRTYHVVDFACGGGDTLRRIHHWAKKEGFQLKLSGFDILPEAIEYARNTSANYPIEFKEADFNDFDPNITVDIACCALVCHHFYDQELLHFLGRMRSVSKVGVVINDLHRHPLAYHSIKLLTKALSKSKYVKNDAPLSVWRGFKMKEWERILREAGYSNYQLQWVWAFRHLIVENLLNDV
jgi:SAM-dependent methyltransferase